MELLIITPETRLIEETVDEVILPGKLGDMGILPGHTHLISELEIGIVLYRTSGENNTKAVYIESGIVEINNDAVKILTPGGIKAEDIDAEEVKKEIEIVERDLNNENIIQDKEKFNALELTLRKARAKLDAAKFH